MLWLAGLFLAAIAGDTVAYEHKVYPHGIAKYIMVKHDQNAT